MDTMKVKVKGGEGEIEVDIGRLPDRIYRAIFRRGLVAYINRPCSHLKGVGHGERAVANLQAMYDGSMVTPK